MKTVERRDKRRKEDVCPRGIEAARLYRSLGWMPIPIPPRSKGPNLVRWQKLRLAQDELDDYFTLESNVGVLLGDPSGGLVDVDIDCIEALNLADLFLPPSLEFGRIGAPRSHRIYVAEGAGTVKFVDPSPPLLRNGKRDGVLVELRSTGAQTVFPGSVHESGEEITWTNSNLELSMVERTDAGDLLDRVRRLAAASLSLPRFVGHL